MVGEWKGKDLVVQIGNVSGQFVMTAPINGDHSLACKAIDQAVMFQWSRNHEIMVLRPKGNNTAVLTCYSSAAEGSWDGGRLPTIRARWHKTMSLGSDPK